MSRLRVLVTVPQPLRGHILTPETQARLLGFADVTMNQDGRNWSAEELAAKLPGFDVMIASWGLPRLTEEVLAGADRLRLIAYAAGSVKGFITDTVFDHGIAVSHAAARIAESVAELTLLLAMMGLRRPQDFDRRMKAGEEWPASRGLPLFEIAGMQVGLLGMGYVGRRSAQRFKAVGAQVWAYDPYLSAETAQTLGVRKAELDELLSQCPVISVHLPVTQETHHLLGARELSLLQNGAVFINTARAWVVDQNALITELATGRFWAALDVFDPEPLPIDHPLRHMDNVLLTPHIAGLTQNSYHDLMTTMVAEAERLAKEEPLQYQVTREMLATMA